MLPAGMIGVAKFVMLAGLAGIYINAILMVLNLLPLPPLDGGRVVSGLLPRELARNYDRIEPYGLFILVGLLITGLLGHILWPFVSMTVVGLLHVTGLAVGQANALLMLLFPH
jgi:Zn-dependent protease